MFNGSARHGSAVALFETTRFRVRNSGLPFSSQRRYNPRPTVPFFRQCSSFRPESVRNAQTTGGAFMKRFTVLLVLLALVAVPVFGATYGTIKVMVTDNSGAPLPGATVEATSPTFIGTRTEVTDANGVANLS